MQNPDRRHRMKPTENTVFPFTEAIYLRAIHVLNPRTRNQWHSDMAALRTAMDHLIESEYAKELELFNAEFAERLVQEGGWELQFVPGYMRNEDGVFHITHEDAKALLENWPDPTRLPDGFPDQKISDIEALEEVVRIRRKSEQKDYPSEAQAYALMALEKIFMIDALVSKAPQSSTLRELPADTLLRATDLTIESMEMICAAERRLVQEKLPVDTADHVRRLESEAQELARRSMAVSGAKSRWANSPKTAAKQQIKECWEMWHHSPGRYRSKKEFAFDMLSKYPELENPETIQRWCRIWQKEVASNITTMPARS